MQPLNLLLDTHCTYQQCVEISTREKNDAVKKMIWKRQNKWAHLQLIEKRFMCFIIVSFVSNEQKKNRLQYQIGNYIFYHLKVFYSFSVCVYFASYRIALCNCQAKCESRNSIMRMSNEQPSSFARSDKNNQYNQSPLKEFFLTTEPLPQWESLSKWDKVSLFDSFLFLSLCWFWPEKNHSKEFYLRFVHAKKLKSLDHQH